LETKVKLLVDPSNMESTICKKKLRLKEELNPNKSKTFKKQYSNNLPKLSQTQTFSTQTNQEESSTFWAKSKFKRIKTGKIWAQFSKRLCSSNVMKKSSSGTLSQSIAKNLQIRTSNTQMIKR
jgi:hypothetical protein